MSKFKVENVRENGLSNSERCLICGTKENLTIHSLFGKHKPPFKIFCRKHHDMIELVKKVIKIMEREKKVTMKEFRLLCDKFKDIF